MQLFRLAWPENRWQKIEQKMPFAGKKSWQIDLPPSGKRRTCLLEIIEVLQTFLGMALVRNWLRCHFGLEWLERAAE